MKKLILGVVVLSSVTFAEINLNSCKGCHGQNFEKAALGKSKIVADMTKDEVSKSLLGYKNGTYGGAMAGVMKAQVMRYSDEELSSTNLGK